LIKADLTANNLPLTAQKLLSS